MRWATDRLFFRLLLLAVLIIGFCGVILPPILKVSWDYGILDELGKALLIAGILGFTIEPPLRRAIAKDVFSAAFGYHMPDDFKDEIARISSYRIICIKHIMDVRIRRYDDSRVLVHVFIERTFQNIGSTIARIQAQNWIDEWGADHKSAIIRCDIISNGGNKKSYSPSDIEYLPNLSFRAKSPSIFLLPDAIATQIVEYEVFRMNNDFIYEQFMSPTRNPEIRILERPVDFDAVADSGGGRLRPTEIADRYELDGVYFPPAPMKIRWWPKSAAVGWPLNVFERNQPPREMPE